MERKLLRMVAHLPDVIGEGGLFAFSGLDGETRTLSGFTGTWGAEPYSLLFHTKRRRVLRLGLTGPQIHTDYVTGDACRLSVGGKKLVLAYSAWHTLVGSGPATPALTWEDGSTAEQGPDGLSFTSDAAEGNCIALAVAGPRFALSYGTSVEEAAARASVGLGVNAEGEAAARLRIYDGLPTISDTADARLLHKCVSVMKVNTLAPEGPFRQMWSTPDRVPHKDMWLWDTVFHSWGMNELQPDVSWQCLKTMLDAANEDGMIVHQVAVGGRRSSITQPPILAWGVWANYEAERDRDKLRYALPILERYLEWDIRHRDKNGNGLLEWHIQSNVLCRSGESGMDNSPRFDEALDLDAVDFSTFAALDMEYVACMAEELGQKEKATMWQERSQAMAARIISELWSETDGFFYDKRMDGQPTGVQAVSGFLPLLLKQLPEKHVDRLLDALRDPARFGAPYPVPSVALSDESWGTDMWRGPSWINLNYLIVQGLRLHGRDEEAGRLAEQTMRLVGRYFERYGVTFEYYDSRDERPPVACDRKGPVKEKYDLRQKVDSIRDYHWTAALTACLILDKHRLRRKAQTVSGTRSV